LLGVDHTTVGKYTADIQKKTNDNLVKAINKQDQKKLRMLERYSPQQIDEILKMMQMNKAVEVNEMI
jgi:hypothetical protein